MKTLPINIIIENQACLVVGGGSVALRKVQRLLRGKASVTLIAPEIHPELRTLAQQDCVKLIEKPYQKGFCQGFILVIAATNDPEVNQHVYNEAMRMGIPVNVVDDPDHCSFFFTSIIEQANIQFSISSDGSTPFAVKRLRKLFEPFLSSPKWSDWCKQAIFLRKEVNKRIRDHKKKNEIFDLFFTGTITLQGCFTIRKLDDNSWQELLSIIERLEKQQ